MSGIQAFRGFRFLWLWAGLAFLNGDFSALGQQTQTNDLPMSLTQPEMWTPDKAPFSFRYGGKDSKQLLGGWKVSHERVPNTVNFMISVDRYTYTDPVTRLKVIAEVRRYVDFPEAVDWVIRFMNEGTSNTPVMENILPLDWAIPSSGDTATVRHDRGSLARKEDFMPMEERLRHGETVHLESSDGDSSSGESLPFFNLQDGQGGLIEAIGWTGNWKADFVNIDGEADKEKSLIALKSGMKKTHLVLHSGEEIRTPRIVLMRWSGGDWVDSQNRWRRLLFAHYTRQVGVYPEHGAVLFGSWGSEPIKDKLALLDWVHKNEIPVQVYAVDAGWYGDSYGAESDPTNPWWKNRGDWFPSPRYYPNGIKPLGEAAYAAGLGFSLWLEPETSMEGRKIIREHPDWFLHTDQPKFTEGFANPGVAMADLGNPAALAGITDLISRFIEDNHVSWLRQDFNIPPERYWELKDSPDRVGMAEIGHIEGLYDLWDNLLAKYVWLDIDNCASGGRRLDIEMMSRSFVAWRTDYGFADTLAEQAQTQALALWVPENMGFESFTASKPWTKPGPYDTAANLYLMRLAYSAGYGVGPGAAGVTNEIWIAWIKQAIGEFREVQEYFYGDFYPLLSYSLSPDAWTAWQFDRPEQKNGLVIVLRRPESPFTSMNLHLKKVDADSLYRVEIRTGYKHAPAITMKGNELAHLPIEMPDAPDSVLIFYKRK